MRRCVNGPFYLLQCFSVRALKEIEPKGILVVPPSASLEGAEWGMVEMSLCEDG